MRKRVLVGVALVVLGLGLAASVQGAVATVSGTVNIAAAANGGKIIGFSSEMLDENKRPVPEWQINNLIDGQYVVGNSTPADSYGWSSVAPPSEENPEWFIVGFTNPNTGQEVTHLISRIVIDPTTDDPAIIGRWVRGITLQTSATSAKGPWTTIGRYLVVNRPVKQTFDFPPTEARYVRVLITSNHGSDRCVQMGEFEVYQAIIPGEQLDELIIRMENLLEDLKRYRAGQLYQIQQENTTAVTTKPPAGTPAAPATPATPATPAAPATPVTPATPAPPGPTAATPLNLGVLSLEAPPGWTPTEDILGGSDNLRLILSGPEVGGAPLIFTVEDEPLPADANLAAFVDLVVHRWPGATLQRSRALSLGGGQARQLEFVQGGQAYLLYCLVTQGRGVVLTAVAPAEALDQVQPALEPLLASVKLP
jgi:hypothetical protein